MNHYYTSKGERISKSRIDALVRIAKEKALTLQRDEFGYNFCVECKRSGGVRLDCSHTISVDEAQKTRRTELAFDVNNIQILCRQHHEEHDRKSRIDWHNENEL